MTWLLQMSFHFPEAIISTIINTCSDTFHGLKTKIPWPSSQVALSSVQCNFSKENWAPKNWCFSIAMLKKTLESPLDCKEIKSVNPKGNQSWIFVGRTDAESEAPILWPPDLKNWLIGKDPDAGKDLRQEEKGMPENEMVGWHHWLDGHEFEQALGVDDGQGVLACCIPWRHKEFDMTERLNWTELNQCRKLRHSSFIPGLGRSLAEEHGNPLKYFYLENPMDREAQQAMIHRVAKSRTWLKWFSTHAYTCTHTPPAPSSTLSFLDFLKISFSLSLSLSHTHTIFT